MATDLGYVADRSQGVGGRTPRAYLRTSARTLDLLGTWRFRLCATADGTGPAFVEDGFDDAAWDALRIPSHWVLEPVTPPGETDPRSLRGTAHGPLYTNTALPIPLDPLTSRRKPHRRLPAGVRPPAGVATRRSVLRFLGVDSCAKVWLNGTELGHFKGSRLPYEFDVGSCCGPAATCWPSGSTGGRRDLPGGPGHVVAAGDLPGRGAAGTSVRLVRRRRRAGGLRHVHGAGTLRVEATAPGLVESRGSGSATCPPGPPSPSGVEPWRRRCLGCTRARCGRSVTPPRARASRWRSASGPSSVVDGVCWSTAGPCSSAA